MTNRIKPLVIYIDDDPEHNEEKLIFSFFEDSAFDKYSFKFDKIPSFEENIFLDHKQLIENYKLKKLLKYIYNNVDDKYVIIMKKGMMTFIPPTKITLMINEIIDHVNTDLIFFHKYNDIFTHYRNTNLPYVKYTVSPSSISSLMIFPHTSEKIIKHITGDKSSSSVINELSSKDIIRSAVIVPNMFDIDINKIDNNIEHMKYNSFRDTQNNTVNNQDTQFYTFVSILACLIIFVIILLIIRCVKKDKVCVTNT